MGYEVQVFPDKIRKEVQVIAMPDKIVIVVEKGNYTDGREFTSVNFSASTYGSAGPYDSQEQIDNAIQHAKEWIEREGDNWAIDNRIGKDLEIKGDNQKLNKWF